LHCTNPEQGAVQAGPYVLPTCDVLRNKVKDRWKEQLACIIIYLTEMQYCSLPSSLTTGCVVGSISWIFSCSYYNWNSEQWL